ncbi:hypothetical protein SDC9_130636 [bioreactor metagenome]|uniref:Uncharacterized protein n=1 Tax=bioreactor metagenome TaxID=1076179 RepID=A0A645D4K1_9ZZZZ
MHAQPDRSLGDTSFDQHRVKNPDEMEVYLVEKVLVSHTWSGIQAICNGIYSWFPSDRDAEFNKRSKQDTSPCQPGALRHFGERFDIRTESAHSVADIGGISPFIYLPSPSAITLIASNVVLLHQDRFAP